MSLVRIRLLACLFVTLSGCGTPDPSPDQDVTLSLTASAIRLQQLTPQSVYQDTLAASLLAASPLVLPVVDVITGDLSVTNTANGEQKNFSWSITMDLDTLEVQSNRTIVLSPGNYQFSLLLTEGTEQYAGTTTVDITDGANTVDMTISPIIGDTGVNTTVIGRLNDFRVAYDPVEFANIADPRIGVAVDGAPETIYQLSKVTGAINSYINLSSGTHQLDLRLYDGALQIGKSLDAQETVTVAPGLDLTMDLVALVGQTRFELTLAGGDAQFSFEIPAEIVDEAGGANNLEARISLVGNTNAFQEQVLMLTPGPTGAYLATATFDNMQYGTVTASLTFTDISVNPTELLGSCSQPLVLGGSDSTLLCNFALRRRAVISGKLLATVGINVFNADGEPVSGAQITSGSTVLGTTNSGFGSPGYLKVFLPAGQHMLVAAAAGLQGNTTIDVAPLSIENVVIQLPPVPPTPVTVSFADAATGTPVVGTLTVRVEGAGKDFVRDSNGNSTNIFTVSNGSLAFQLAGSAAPSPVNPVELILIVQGNGFVNTSTTQNIISTAPGPVAINLINIGAPPLGVNLVSDNSGQADTSGTVTVEAEIDTAPDPQTGATATVTIPAGTVVTDASGTPLSGTLTTDLAYFSPREEESMLAFPGGLDVNVNGNPSGQSNGLFKSAGMVQVEIRDSSGRVARNFSGAGLEIKISVPAGTINPLTNQVIANNDPVPVWSNDTNTGEWSYEGEATAVVVQPLDGGETKTTFTFRARHLSLWNLDWFISPCSFSRQIRIVDDFLNPVPNATAATFSYRIFIADAMGVFGGYIKDVPANNLNGSYNILQFQNAPNVNVMYMKAYDSMGEEIGDRSFNDASNTKLCEGTGDLFLTVTP